MSTLTSLQAFQSHIGALCEVMNDKNILLFVGILSEVDLGQNAIRVDLRQGESTPRGIIYNTEIKVRIHTGGREGNLLILYGTVMQNSPEYWRIEIQDTVSHAEQRSNFRVRTKADAVLVPELSGAMTLEEPKPIQCQLYDISLTGVCLVSRVELQPGDRYQITDLQLSKGGYVYQLPCIVQRTADIPDNIPGTFAYGCQFTRIGPGLENRLCQDLFALQSKAISRK